jgi:cob(I)alamin adenosyltransferase
MRIYTKTGDTGETGLFDGTRVSKADPRVDAYGEVDELNAAIGAARSAFAGTDALLHDVDEALELIQRELFAVGAMLADPRHKIAPRVAKATIGPAAIERLERTIDRLEAGIAPLRRFILPGGALAGALLHLARTVCRRAERKVIGLGGEAVDPIAIVYLNRLSDLLFVMARAVNHRAGRPEIEW